MYDSLLLRQASFWGPFDHLLKLSEYNNRYNHEPYNIYSFQHALVVGRVHRGRHEPLRADMRNLSAHALHLRPYVPDVRNRPAFREKVRLAYPVRARTAGTPRRRSQSIRKS